MAEDVYTGEDDFFADPNAETYTRYSPFEWIANLTINKMVVLDESHLVGYDQYMINKFVAMNQSWVHISEVASQFKHMDDLTHYNFYFHALPQIKAYSKNHNKKRDPKKDLAEKLVMRWFECGSRDAKSHIKMLGSKKVTEICKQYPEWKK